MNAYWMNKLMSMKQSIYHNFEGSNMKEYKL